MKEKREHKKTKDADQRKMDEVLRKMLNSPAVPPKKSKTKPGHK